MMRILLLGILCILVVMGVIVYFAIQWLKPKPKPPELRQGFVKMATKEVTLPDWSLRDEEFIKELMPDDADPVLTARIWDVRDIVPEADRKYTFIAGGFAAHLAGITNEHGDIDIFCTRAKSFDAIRDNLLVFHEITTTDPLDVEGYGRVSKFRMGNLKYDLVDVTKWSISDSVRGLLTTFDVSWSMVAITLDVIPKIWMHQDAFLGYPKLNPDSSMRHLHGTRERLPKYKNRLVRPVDEEAYESIRSTLEAVR